MGGSLRTAARFPAVPDGARRSGTERCRNGACSPIVVPQAIALHNYPPGGGSRNRTGDLLLAKQTLSQLSYAPTKGRLTESKITR